MKKMLLIRQEGTFEHMAVASLAEHNEIAVILITDHTSTPLKGKMYLGSSAPDKNLPSFQQYGHDPRLAAIMQKYLSLLNLPENSDTFSKISYCPFIAQYDGGRHISMYDGNNTKHFDLVYE